MWFKKEKKVKKVKKEKKEKKVKTKSFRVNILQAFSLILLITIVSITLIFYYKSSEAILKFSKQVTKEVSEKIIEKVTNYLNVPAMQTRTISKLVTDPDIMEIHEQLWKYMWEQLMVLPQVQAIFLADLNGSYVQVRREPKLATRYIDRSKNNPIERWFYRDVDYNLTGEKTKIPTFDPRIRPWFKNTKTEKKVYWTDVYVFTTAQTPGISATYPVLDADGKLISIVCINSPLHSLSTFIAKQKVSENGIVFIINEKSEVVAYPDASLTIRKDLVSGKLRLANINDLKQQSIIDANNIFQQTKKNRFISVTDKERFIVNYVPFPKSFASKWYIVIIMPEDDILGSVKTMRLQVAIFSIVIFIISFIALYYFTSKITKPLIMLIKDAEKIKDFKLDNIVGVKSKIHEIELMSRAIVTTTKGLQSFKKYVPAGLVRQLIQLGKEAKLGGETKELTIFFSDIIGFTTLSEKMSAKALMLHLSEYFEALSNIIMEENGTIDKYIGDAIMVFWGAPVKLLDGPIRACRTAILCREKIKVLNQKWIADGKPAMNTRMGIHTGETVIGNVGSKSRLNYTIIGDSVNLTARLEGANKIYGTEIIISEETYKYVSDDFICRPLDIVTVKGKTTGIKIYELVAEKTDVISAEKQEFINGFTKGWEAYLEQNWKYAIEIFLELQKKYQDDKSLMVFLDRCRQFSSFPEKIPNDWDGTTVLIEK